MPTVPDAVRNDLSPPVFQRRQRDPNAFGAAGAAAFTSVGQNLSNSGTQLNAFALASIDAEQDRQAKEYDTALAAAYAGIGSGTEDTPGYYSLQGQNAVDGFGPAEARMREARAKVIQNEVNPAVRRRFNASADARTVSELSSMQTHRGREHMVALDVAGTARVAQAVSDAGRFWQDRQGAVGPDGVATAPSRFEQEIQRIRGEVADEVGRKGLSDDVAIIRVQEEVGKAVSNGVLAALGADSVEGMEGAADLLGQYRGQVSTDTFARLNKLFTQENLSTQAQILVASARSQANPDGTPFTPAQVRQYIQDEASGKLEDAGLKNYNARIGELRGDLAAEKAIEAERQRVLDQARTNEERADITAGRALGQKAIDLHLDVANPQAGLDYIKRTAENDKVRDEATADFNTAISAIGASQTRDIQVAREARSILSAANSAADRAAKDNHKSAQDDATEHVDGGSPIKSLDPLVRAQLTTADLNALEALERHRINGTLVQTNYSAYGRYMELTGEDAADIDLLEAKSVLGPAEFNIVRAHATAAIIQGAQPKRALTNTQIVNASVKRLGLDSEEAGQLNAAVQEELISESSRLARPLTDEEVRKVVSGMTDAVDLRGAGLVGIFDKEMAFFKVGEEISEGAQLEINGALGDFNIPEPALKDRITMFIARENNLIPFGVQAQIINAYIQAGRPFPSVEQIVETLERQRQGN